ncbi:MAG: DNA repair protein RecO [Pseudohongiellaceae bacterium]|nr:DNA repair protein RecO [Pseudohongiellaceae bacterium]
MSSRINLQPAYVLHTQAFQNTSLLVDFFCIDYGRVRAVAKGARRNKSKTRSYLQAFQPLLIGLSGRGELKTLSAVEGSVSALTLVGRRLFCGMYINELMVRLVQSNEAHPELYEAYQQSLIGLHGDGDVEQILRAFEFSLLHELGYGIDMTTEAHSGALLEDEGRYLFFPDRGFVSTFEVSNSDNASLNEFSGVEISQIRSALKGLGEHPAASRRLARQTLQFYLGDKPLMSRSLFSASGTKKT